MLMFVTSSSLRNTNSIEKNEKYKEHEENECVDVSRFGPVQYEETDFELCDFKKTTHCKKHSKEICHDVQIQKCKLVGYADCKDLEKMKDQIPRYQLYLLMIGMLVTGTLDTLLIKF